MRFFKLAIISVIVLFLIATSIGLLLPPSVVVSRVVEVSAPKDSIFVLASNMYNWPKWINGLQNNANVQIQSATQANLNGTKVVITATDSFIIHSNWTGKNGTTQQSILRIIQPNNANNTIVQWQFTEKLKWYPWQRIGSIMNEAVIGTQLETNLATLKKISESSK